LKALKSIIFITHISYIHLGFWKLDPSILLIYNLNFTLQKNEEFFRWNFILILFGMFGCSLIYWNLWKLWKLYYKNWLNKNRRKERLVLIKYIDDLSHHPPNHSNDNSNRVLKFIMFGIVFKTRVKPVCDLFYNFIDFMETVWDILSSLDP
jgi:hypothetical protein